MNFHRISLVIAVLMVAASIGAVVVRPATRAASPAAAFSLETMIPKQFGDWREEPLQITHIVNPQEQAALDEIYDQVLTRNYVNTNGYRIMLAVAYGSDQRGSFGAHDPEICYTAGGFTLHKREETQLATPYGEVPVRRMFTSKGAREEPVTYWFRIGDTAVQGWQRRLIELNYSLTGRIPEGLLFRVSSLDPDQARANEMHDQFSKQLLQSVSALDRQRLSGLGNS